MTQEDIKKRVRNEFVEKFVSEWIFNDGADNLMWDTKAPSPKEVMYFISQALDTALKEWKTAVRMELKEHDCASCITREEIEKKLQELGE